MENHAPNSVKQLKSENVFRGALKNLHLPCEQVSPPVMDQVRDLVKLFNDSLAYLIETKNHVPPDFELTIPERYYADHIERYRMDAARYTRPDRGDWPQRAADVQKIKELLMILPAAHEVINQYLCYHAHQDVPDVRGRKQGQGYEDSAMQLPAAQHMIDFSQQEWYRMLREEIEPLEDGIRDLLLAEKAKKGIGLREKLSAFFAHTQTMQKKWASIKALFRRGTGFNQSREKQLMACRDGVEQCRDRCEDIHYAWVDAISLLPQQFWDTDGVAGWQVSSAYEGHVVPELEDIRTILRGLARQ